MDRQGGTWRLLGSVVFIHRQVLSAIFDIQCIVMILAFSSVLFIHRQVSPAIFNIQWVFSRFCCCCFHPQTGVVCYIRYPMVLSRIFFCCFYPQTGVICDIRYSMVLSRVFFCCFRPQMGVGKIGYCFHLQLNSSTDMSRSPPFTLN